jgi:hypothetical protein
VSEAIAATDPRVYTTAFAKVGRERKILIDYLRNSRTNTTIAAYLFRGGPVSMPVNWTELTTTPDRWTVKTAVARLRSLKTDPWVEYWKTDQPLTDKSVNGCTRYSPARYRTSKPNVEAIPLKLRPDTSGSLSTRDRHQAAGPERSGTGGHYPTVSPRRIADFGRALAVSSDGRPLATGCLCAPSGSRH